MGILDDAIREHLDLKRKHGARDAELQQLEDEAFGPPTRPDEPDFPERPPTGEEDVVVAEAATEEGVQPGAEESEPYPLEEATAPEPPPPAVFDHASEEPIAPPVSDSELDPVPAAEPEPEPEAIVGEPTVEHPAPEPEVAADADVAELEPQEDQEEFEEFRETEGSEEEGEEDVLEETPEFLRDTPENERLWFEQGEPQDFDFDDEDGEEGR
jgi:hypothetical protein